MIRRAVFLVALAAASAGAAAAETQPASAPAGERWAAAVAQLSSEDFAERQAGQKALQKATPRDRAALRRLAAGARDPEVTDRLAQRLEELDEEAATNPPPISLDLHDARFGAMVDALGRAIDVPLQASQEQGGPSYTLHAVDESFPEIFLELSKQGGFRPDYQGSQVDPAGPLRRGAISGAFLICPTMLTYERVIDCQQDAAAAASPAPTLTLNLTIFCDPRVRIIQNNGVELTSVRDSAGEDLLLATDNAANGPQGPAVILRRLAQRNVSPTWTFDVVQRLQPAGPEVRRIDSLKGVAHFVVEVARQRVVVPDLEKKVNSAIMVGDRQVTFTKFELNAQKMIEFSMDSVALAPNANGLADEPMTISMTDGAGKPIVTQSLAGGWSGGLGGPFVSPIKATFSITTKTKELDVPFELKDLPLP